MSSLNQLRAKVRTAREVYEKVQQEALNTSRDLTRGYEEVIKAKVERDFGERIKAAAADLKASAEALSAERLRMALAGEGALVPVGTEYARWFQIGGVWHLREGEFGGVAELVLPSSRFSKGLHPIFHPAIGDTIIRLRHKRGMSLNFRKLGEYGVADPDNPLRGWYRVGVTPADVEARKANETP